MVLTGIFGSDGEEVPPGNLKRLVVKSLNLIDAAD
jgi:hypothetical protein